MVESLIEAKERLDVSLELIVDRETKVLLQLKSIKRKTDLTTVNFKWQDRLLKLIGLRLNLLTKKMKVFL